MLVDEIFDAITTDRQLRQRILTGEYAQIVENHKRLLIRTLKDWDWLSAQLAAQDTATQKRLLITELHAKKWKSMVLMRRFTGLSILPPLLQIRVTGTESPHWKRTRSNAWIYYRGASAEKCFGEILYFISMHDPRHWPFDDAEERDESPADRPKIHLAVVRKHVTQSIACLRRIRNKRPRTSVEVIVTDAIEDEVGLVYAGDFRYIVTSNTGSYCSD